MSTRPSNNYSAITCPSNNTEYAIIGNTVAALMTVLKLRKEGVTQKLHVISGTYSNIYNKDVDNIDYIIREVKTILHSLLNDKCHYIGNDRCPRGALSHYFVERCTFYTYGCGLLGDVIASPKLPNFGPWYQKFHGNSNQVQRFVDTFTTHGPLNLIEQIMADRLNFIWSIPFSSTVTVDTPSIMCKHFLLKKLKHNRYVRELFKEMYEKISQLPDVEFHNSKNTLFFEPSLITPGNYDIQTRDWNLNNVKLIFKTNPYAFLSTAGKGGLCVDPVAIPAFYRAVIPINANGTLNVGTVGPNNHGVVYSPIQIPTIPDPQNIPGCNCPGATPLNCSNKCPVNNTYVIAENTFSLPDTDAQSTSNTSINRITWAAHQYLVREDYFPTNQTGWFAGQSRNLMIVEAVCYDNKRNVTFNDNNQELQISYGERLKEEKFLLQFAKIVVDVIFCYTGIPIIPDSLLADQTLDVSNGAAMDSNMIENITLRETSLTIMLEMIAGIFDQNFYTVYGAD